MVVKKFKETVMKRILLITISLLVSGHINSALGTGNKDAHEINLSKEKPEATMVKAIYALISNDKEAFMALCSDGYKNELTKNNFTHYNDLRNIFDGAEPEKNFLYSVSKIKKLM